MFGRVRPVISGIARELSKDTELMGYLIPAGV